RRHHLALQNRGCHQLSSVLSISAVHRHRAPERHAHRPDGFHLRGRPLAPHERGQGAVRGQGTGTNTASNSQDATAAGNNESRRSIMPPCPGSRLPMSLMPRSRFTSDSNRSPIEATITITAPKTTPCQYCAPNRKCSANAPANTPASIDPEKPSQVFFGLIDGA